MGNAILKKSAMSKLHIMLSMMMGGSTKADANIADKNGWTPLHVAASNGNDLVVEKLLVAGADVNIATKDSETPLHVAARYGEDAVVEKLLAAGADANTAARNGEL